MTDAAQNGKAFSSSPAQLPAGPAPSPASGEASVGVGGRGFANSPQKGCSCSQHASWPSVFHLKSVCLGVPVRLDRQQYLLINLFIDLLGCTWGFSREELQTSRLPSIQPSVRLKFGLEMPQGWGGQASRQCKAPEGLLGRAAGTEGRRSAGEEGTSSAAPGPRHAASGGNGAPGSLRCGAPGGAVTRDRRPEGGGEAHVSVPGGALLQLRGIWEASFPDAGDGGAVQGLRCPKVLRFMS